MSIAATRDGLGAIDAPSDAPRTLELIVPGMHCAGCIRTIETGLNDVAGVVSARANLGERRVRVTWKGEDAAPITDRLTQLGFDWHQGDDNADDLERETSRELLISLAVAGFAAANVMLLSVSVWSGAEAETRSLFHWISALIATPAVLFAGRPFYRSAARALAAGRLNMDVPISLAVLMALAMSLVETILDGEVAYFDASISLLFFLLIGRALDHHMRQRARHSLSALARLVPDTATVIGDDGEEVARPLSTIFPGTRLRIRPGDRVPIDGRVVAGESDIDISLVTGESIPIHAEKGTTLQAGTLTINGSLELETTALSRDSFIARMREMMTAAENGRAGHRRIADRVAALYAPVVHLLALLTFIGWMTLAGDWRDAIYAAITVLIITCPCALGLAVPVVQVVAAGRLFQSGILARSGEALERAADVDHVIFDKTGTLTLGEPRLINAGAHSDRTIAIAAGLARNSRHPLCRALVQAAKDRAVTSGVCRDVSEHAGLGLEGQVEGTTARLGSAAWCGVTGSSSDASNIVCLTIGDEVSVFHLADRDRPGIETAIARLRTMGLDLEILSGDRAEVVVPMAERLGIDQYTAGLTPNGKLDRIRSLSDSGTGTMMVGDGLNDVPVLAAADVSVTPMSAADIGRASAGFVSLRDSLEAVPEIVEVARLARRRVRENIALAIAYNCIAVPIAMAGLATPLIATIAMSSSSIIVIANALRLQRARRPATKTASRKDAGMALETAT
jgi:Cu2+-exporting ATPase